MVYKHAYLNTLLLLYLCCIYAEHGEDAAIIMPLKGEVGGHALNSHGNYFVDHGISWKNHGIVSLNFCGNHVKGAYPGGFITIDSLTRSYCARINNYSAKSYFGC